MGGASGETEEKEVFTDEPEIEEEKETPVAAAGVPEVEDGFSDGILDAAQDTSVTTKHTVTIDTSPSYKIGTDTMYDVINNHDGTLTVGEDPEIKGSQNELRHVYRCVYESDGSESFFDMFQNPENPENGSWSTTCNKPIPSTPNRKIQIDNIYTCFLVTTTNAIVTEDNKKYYGVANKQIVTNPIKVNYNLLGGSGVPTTDWVWNADGLWKNAHDTEPTKAGYKFDGWYTEPNGNGIKIDTVSQAVDNARVGSNGYKEVTLYAKWEHKHVWQYSESGDTLKAYCSNTDSQCEYHGTSFDNAKATVSLKLNGFDSDKCAKYGSIYDVTYDNNNFTSETGATIGTIQYVGRDGTKYLESPVLPISPGKYKAKVNITLLEDQNSREISTDFEIKPLPAKLDWSSSDLTYNGEDQTVTASVKNALPGDGFTLEYETNEIYTNTGKNAQTYKAKVTDLGNANYSLSEEESVYLWEIKKAPVTLTVVLDEFTYGEQPVIKLQGAPSDSKVVYQYKVKDKDDSTYAGITEEGLKKLSAGEYTLKAVVEETKNYKGFSATCDFKIKKASTTNSDSKVSISGWTYGGYNEAENTPSIDPSLNPENQTVRYTYYTDEACTTQTSTENGAEAAGGVPKNAGTYYVKAQIPESANYNAGTATGTFEIKPLPVKLNWSSSDLTYNGKDQTVTAKVTNALPGDTFTLTYETNETYTNSGKNARKYTAKVTALGNTNYSFSQEESIHPWVINPKAVTVKPDDLYKHIGGEEPQLTYTTDGIVEGETLSGITLQRVSGEDARKYEITATETEGANPNYTVTRETGIFTIEDHNWPKDGKILSPATSWSKGMQERTCTAPGCGQKRYDAIPKQYGKPADTY